MTNAIALFSGSSDVVLSAKTGKTGSFAKAVAFATRDARMDLSRKMYANWLANGTYRPVVNDILSSGLVPKSAVPYVAGFLPDNGAIRKEQLINLCNNIDFAIRQSGKEIKGQKAFMYGLVQAIVSESREGDVVSEQ